jgi:hypothetical protein
MSHNPLPFERFRRSLTASSKYPLNLLDSSLFDVHLADLNKELHCRANSLCTAAPKNGIHSLELETEDAGMLLALNHYSTD